MRTVYVGTVLAGLSAMAMVGAWVVPSISPNELWPGIVPFMAGLGLLIISGFMLLNSQPDGKSNDADQDSNDSEVLLVIALLFVAVTYLKLIGWFGYIAPTTIIAPLVAYLFGVRSPIGLLLIAVLCPMVFYAIFFEVLGVFPPYGTILNPFQFLQG